MPLRLPELPIPVRNDGEVELIRRAGHALAGIMEQCREACKAGTTTGEVDEVAAKAMEDLGAESLFKWYPDYRPGKGFPACTCISVNEEVVHGIPGDRIFREGDLVSIDCGIRLDGWCADCAISVAVGHAPIERVRLQEMTRGVLAEAIRLIRPGKRWSEVARAMQAMAEEGEERYGIVKEYVGHGIGRKLHEAPKVPGFVSGDFMHEDFTLKTGMVLAIEPMLTLGSGATKVLKDGWTVVTADRSVAAHEEHTVAVRRNGAEILTKAG